MTWPRVWLITTGWSKESISCRRVGGGDGGMSAARPRPQ
jgi:hypothetical protein